MHKEVNPEIQIPNPDLGSPPSSGDQQKVDCPTSPHPLALLPSRPLALFCFSSFFEKVTLCDAVSYSLIRGEIKAGLMGVCVTGLSETAFDPLLSLAVTLF